MTDLFDHAEELARRFESLDPTQMVEISVEEYLLQRAVLARAHSERQLIEAVLAARRAGLTWQSIGSLLGTSAQAAQQRYGVMRESA